MLQDTDNEGTTSTRGLRDGKSLLKPAVGGRQSARPCPESPGLLSAGSSGSHTNCGPTPASSGLQTPGLAWKGGPREAHLSHPESCGYWGPPAADCHLLTHLPADLHNSGPARRRRHLFIGARPCPGNVLFLPAGVCQGPLHKVSLAHLTKERQT